MQAGHVTTPFGRRPMTYAMLESQWAGSDVEEGGSVDKWRIFRALCEARLRLGVSDRALAVLNALLSFYPKAELAAEDALVVFPSNAQLSRRAHGMAEPTLRRHIAALVGAGLLIRKDSANGKRFARRDRGGEIDEAFGFSLSPLLARAGEIEHMAAEVEAERAHLHRLRERMTICRRDVSKLIITALDEGAAGDWEAVQAQYRGIIAGLPRNATAEMVADTLDSLELLREEIVNRLEMQINSQKQSGNPVHFERHIQNSNPDSTSELEPHFKKMQGEMPQTADVGNEPDEISEKVDPETHENTAPERKSLAPIDGLKPFPLRMVLSACPQIADYGKDGDISTWRDLMAAAVVVRSMLGVSPSAYEEACATIGPENTATVIACILERAGHINSAGGYLRDLTRRASRGEFSLGPMLMAQIKANGGDFHRRSA